MTETFPTQIKIMKTIPSSNWYSGGKQTATIYFHAEEITVNTKKSLIKISQPSAGASQNNNQTDTSKSYIYDLKRVEDTIHVRGWLVDDSTSSAWEKAWKLRAMCVSGNIDGDKGALTEFVMNNITFSSSTQRVYLESVTFIAKPYGSAQNLSDNTMTGQGDNTKTARIECTLDFYVGDPK